MEIVASREVVHIIVLMSVIIILMHIAINLLYNYVANCHTVIIAIVPSFNISTTYS